MHHLHLCFQRVFLHLFLTGGDLTVCLSVHSQPSGNWKWQAGAEETQCQFMCRRVGKPRALIHLCQLQALLTIFNESPLLLLLPSAMTFTI